MFRRKYKAPRKTLDTNELNVAFAEIHDAARMWLSLFINLIWCRDAKALLGLTEKCMSAKWGSGQDFRKICHALFLILWRHCPANGLIYIGDIGEIAATYWWSRWNVPFLCCCLRSSAFQHQKKKKNKMVVINITFFDHSLLDILCASMSRSRRKRVTDLALQGYIRSIYR